MNPDPGDGGFDRMAASRESGYGMRGSSSPVGIGARAGPQKPGFAMRKPRKISVTVPQSVYDLLVVQSDRQGRSLSSLASYWLEVQASRLQADRPASS